MSRAKRVAIPRVIRDAVLIRDRGICGICRFPVHPRDIHIDHVVPVWRGGGTTVENLRVTHARCNLTRDYLEAESFRWVQVDPEDEEWGTAAAEWPEHGFTPSDAESWREDLEDMTAVEDVYDWPPFAPDDSYTRAIFVGEVIP